MKSYFKRESERERVKVTKKRSQNKRKREDNYYSQVTVLLFTIL
jgi:hypothetical protein